MRAHMHMRVRSDEYGRAHTCERELRLTMQFAFRLGFVYGLVKICSFGFVDCKLRT